MQITLTYNEVIPTWQQETLKATIEDRMQNVDCIKTNTCTTAISFTSNNMQATDGTDVKIALTVSLLNDTDFELASYINNRTGTVIL